MKPDRFRFDGRGIGELISSMRLVVPPNQRSYAWRERQVRELLEDLNGAIQNSTDDYFLGTIVLIQEGDAVPLIADGQQRLATISMILARIRDIFFEIKRPQRARSIDDTYLRKIDIDSEQTIPQIALNIEDNDFFRNRILVSPDDPEQAEDSHAVLPSNRRLLLASDQISAFLRKLLSTLPHADGPDYLVKWVAFLKKRVSIVLVTVSDEVGAFRIFETLNDRGLRASQSDILKNYFLSRAGDKAKEAHIHWNVVASLIATIPGDKDDQVIRYIRNVWILENGPIREKDVAQTIKTQLTGELRPMQFLQKMNSIAADYIALWSPSDERWGRYKQSTKESLWTITAHLRQEQIRPLLFAVALKFTPDEADKTYRLFVSWSVRFMIAGGGRGGTLDKYYGDLAKLVGTGAYTKARELREAMKDIVPNDIEFEGAFARARVAKTFLRRYYLRALDKTMKGDPAPEFVANEDADEINLEHVMPVNPEDTSDDDDESIDGVENLLGNMVLIGAKLNLKLANKAPLEKMKEYSESSYLITNQVAEYKAWGLDEIRDRQAKMAKVAVRTWRLDFKEP